MESIIYQDFRESNIFNLLFYSESKIRTLSQNIEKIYSLVIATSHNFFGHVTKIGEKKNGFTSLFERLSYRLDFFLQFF